MKQLELLPFFVGQIEAFAKQSDKLMITLVDVSHNFLEILLLEASGGERGGAEADAAGIQSTLVSRN